MSQNYSVQDLGSALRFVVRYRTQWVTTLHLLVRVLLILFLLAALAWAEWTLIRLMGLRALLLLPLVPPSLLAFARLLYLGARQIVELLWQVVGREELEIDDDGVRLRHVIFGRGTNRRYAKDAVGGVFVSPEREPHPLVAWYAPGTVLRFARFGPSAFESFTRGRVAVGIAAPPFAGARHGPDGACAVHFGSSLESDEAATIVAMIHRPFPSYALRS